MEKILTLKEYSMQEGEKALQYHLENPFIYSNNRKISIDSIYINEKEKIKIQEYYNNLKELQQIAKGERIGKVYLYYYMRVFSEERQLTTEQMSKILNEAKEYESRSLIV